MKKKKYKIIEKNYVSPLGELDIICKDGAYLVFVEVKARIRDDFGGAAHAVDQKKQFKLTKLAQYYLSKNPQYENSFCRFDVVAVDKDKITHIENAFYTSGS